MENDWGIVKESISTERKDTFEKRALHALTIEIPFLKLWNSKQDLGDAVQITRVS